jgi:phenylalanyl-tRNA synthetase beta chain
MKISVNWMKWYGGKGLDVPTDELLERIGAQLGAVEETEDLGAKYRGVLVARVVECVEHPDSDHMHVCKVDDGGKAQGVERDADGRVQVVCGAPNVREGLLVAWLPPGSTVPESVGKDPFVLGSRNLRGVMSNGMLASPRELALGDSHEGILELDEGNPGGDFAEVYGLNDQIIDIENKMFTHRPDCFGQLGVAREIAGISGQKFASPEWYLQVLQDVLQADGGDLPLEVRNELPELVPRFMAVPLSGVIIKPSPVWLQSYLQRVGVRPISNVVDVTNYMMLLTGQPMHAYDYDKVKALDGGDKAVIVVRHPWTDEKILLLNGKEIEPRSEAIMIATDKKLIGVGGVMGGGDTEIDEHTRNIILEVATFDMYSIRRTSMAHGLFTDAVSRFNKGQSPLQNDKLLAKAVEMLREFADVAVAGPVVDIDQTPGRAWVHPPVLVTAQFINERLGFSLSADAMKTLLENVECGVAADGDQLTVTAPFWRTDIETREDVVEEVGRLYGFDKLPLKLPQRSIMPVEKNAMLELKQTIRSALAKAGANEVLTYSFVHGDLMRKAGQNPDDAFQVGNALSPDLQYYRLSLTPSLLDKVHMNIKAGYDELALFELGKGHNLAHASSDDGLPAEFAMLDLIYACADKQAKSGAAFYEARAFLTILAEHFGLELEYRPIAAEESYPVVKPYDHTRSAQVFVKGTDLALGMIGEYKASVRKALKLPVHTAGFGIGVAQLQAALKHSGKTYRPLPRFPRLTQDITLKVSSDSNYQTLSDVVRGALDDACPQRSLWSLELLDIYQRQDSTAHKQITFRLSIASYEKTLTDAEVSALLDRVAAAAAAAIGAERM